LFSDDEEFNSFLSCLYLFTRSLKVELIRKMTCSPIAACTSHPSSRRLAMD